MTILRMFAAKDYEGLSKVGKEALKKSRSALAKNLMSSRKEAQKTMTKEIKKAEDAINGKSRNLFERLTGTGISLKHSGDKSVQAAKDKYQRAVKFNLEKSKIAADRMRNEAKKL